MFKNSIMSFGESLIISGLGLTIVFLALIALAISVLAFSKIFDILIPKKNAEQIIDKKIETIENDEEYAVLVSAIHEELRNTMKGKFRIVSITEIN